MIARNNKPKKKKPSKKQIIAANLKKKRQAWMTRLMAQCLYKLVEIKGPISVTAEQLDSAPEDWLDRVEIQARPEGFTFILKKKEGTIIQPGLVLPG